MGFLIGIRTEAIPFRNTAHHRLIDQCINAIYFRKDHDRHIDILIMDLIHRRLHDNGINNGIKRHHRIKQDRTKRIDDQIESGKHLADTETGNFLRQ